MTQMLDYVYGHDEIVAQFVAQLIPSCRERGLPKASKAIGVIDASGQLIAGYVYHNWEPEAGVIEHSIAALPGRQWFTRETARRMYSYPFDQLGCQMVVGRVSAQNERLLHQMAALNYSLIRVPRMLGRHEDGVLGLLTAEDWAKHRINKRPKRDVLDVATREAA